MRTVYTKSELKAALKAGEKHILCKGTVAKALCGKKRVRKVAIGSTILAGVVGLASLAAAPFTLGTSLGAGAAATAGIVATGLTAGTLTMSTVELAIICGTSLGALGLLVGRGVHVKYNSDGSANLDIE